MNKDNLPNQRILVSDFDSIHQANIWRTEGPERAIKKMVSVLRTALYLGNEITVDRNQLFDGIFFLSLGPDGIANVLGLSPSEPIPIVVTCEKETEGFSSGSMIPILRGAQEVTPYQVSLEFQLMKVRSEEYRKASAALMATIGNSAENGWLCQPTSELWTQGVGLNHFHTPLTDSENVIALIENAQNRWAEAIKNGRISVDLWGRGQQAVKSNLDIYSCLQEIRKKIIKNGVELRPLAKYIFEQSDSSRREVTKNLYNKLKDDNASEEDFDEARLAMEMWSKAYYQALAKQNNNLYLSFYNEEGNQKFAKEYDLALPVRTRYKRFIDRNFSPAKNKNLRVEGEILDTMLIISPAAFSQLYNLTRDIAEGLMSDENSTAMYDLAYATRDAVKEPISLAMKKKETMLRITVTTLVAFIVAILGLFTDLTSLPNYLQISLVVIATLIGLFAGLPWGDMREFFKLRKTSITATLTLNS